jgi:hypothetical protein
MSFDEIKHVFVKPRPDIVLPAKTERLTVRGEWVECDFRDLKLGDLMRQLENAGTKMFKVIGPVKPYDPPGNYMVDVLPM